MCSIAAAALAMSAAGAGMSAYGSYQQSQGQKAAFKYNAQVNDYQAQDARKRGGEAVDRHREQVAALKGKQRARLAASGVDLAEGSALNILTDTDYLGERDALVIRENAEREAFGFESRSELNRYGADQTSPGLAGTSSLLGGAGSVASKWYAFDKAGAFK